MNDGGPDERLGRCHVCKNERKITYCPVCDHWFCGRCRWKLWPRGRDFVMELVGKKQEGCCGPTAVAEGKEGR